jgi:hypothetical protein
MVEKKNMWARSADPKERAKATKQHEKAQNTKEVRTMNVVRQSAVDKLLHKPGKMGKR